MDSLHEPQSMAVPESAFPAPQCKQQCPVILATRHTKAAGKIRRVKEEKWELFARCSGRTFRLRSEHPVKLHVHCIPDSERTEQESRGSHFIVTHLNRCGPADFYFG